MKKREAWVAGILGLIAGQAIVIFSKEKKLRKDMSQAPWLLAKGKLFWNKWLETNKKIIDEITEVDLKETANIIREDAEYDTENIKERVKEKKKIDRETEGKNAMKLLLAKAPTKSTIEESVQKYKTRVLARWDELMETVEEKADEIEEQIEKKSDVIKEKIADKIDKTAENVKAKLHSEEKK